MSDPPTLDRLRATLTESLPYCSGTLELPDDSFELFYGKQSPKFVNLSKTARSPDALDALQSACEPAKFGRGNETVLDESYRKAGKMDSSEFVLRLDVVHSGLLGAACASLLCGEQMKRNVTAELYKLNVYGEGAFFKAHKDTPRSSTMFGSLVVVFPTPHSGGTLVLRHDGKEWTFDSGKVLAHAPNRVAYIAFFSDVEHEVMPVVSGHRVTATYNLYWDDSDPKETAYPDGLNILDPKNANANNIGRELSALLHNPAFMPEGGTLGFRLRHSYPFPRVWNDGDPDPLEQLPRWLKGSDAALYEAFDALGLAPQLRLSARVFLAKREDHGTILLDQCLRFDTMQIDDWEFEDIVMKHGRVVVDDTGDSESDGTEEQVLWVTGSAQDDIDRLEGTARKPNQFSSPYVLYGNESTLEHFYMMACMTVRVGPAGNRTPARAVVQAGIGDQAGGGSRADGESMAEYAQIIRVLELFNR